jgi:hypothetical protein
MDKGHQLLFIVHQALNFIHPRKPTQLLTVWKFSDENHEWWVEARVQDLLEAIEQHPSEDKTM